MNPALAQPLFRLVSFLNETGPATMHNRIMITGAGSGLGREIALRWA